MISCEGLRDDERRFEAWMMGFTSLEAFSIKKNHFNGRVQRSRSKHIFIDFELRSTRVKPSIIWGAKIGNTIMHNDKFNSDLDLLRLTEEHLGPPRPNEPKNQTIWKIDQRKTSVLQRGLSVDWHNQLWAPKTIKTQNRDRWKLYQSKVSVSRRGPSVHWTK